MRKNKTFINFSITCAILSFLIFSASGCVEQNASSVGFADKSESLPNLPLSTAITTNPQILAAEKIIEKAPNSPAGYNALAFAYIRSARESGDFSLNSKAQNAVNRALEIAPDNMTAQKLNTSLMLTFHRFPEAHAAATRLQEKYSQDPFVYGALTDANVELGNYEEAVNNAQQMVDLKPNTESYARVSHLRSLYGDTQGAIEAMNLAARVADPMDKEVRAWCLVRLGGEYFKAGMYKETEAAYNTALKVFPEYHLALAGKGQVLAALGDYENAARFLTQSQMRVPMTETVVLLGDLYTKTGNAEKANEQYQLVDVIEQKLGSTDDRRALAFFWADHDLKLDEALEIAAAENARRKDVYTADVYAWCLYKKGRFDEAKSAINAAMRLKNKDARIFYHAGMIEKALGNKKEARQYLQTALQTNPSFDLLQSENAKAALRELQS